MTDNTKAYGVYGDFLDTEDMELIELFPSRDEAEIYANHLRVFGIGSSTDHDEAKRLESANIFVCEVDMTDNTKSKASGNELQRLRGKLRRVRAVLNTVRGRPVHPNILVWEINNAIDSDDVSDEDMGEYARLRESLFGKRSAI